MKSKFILLFSTVLFLTFTFIPSVSAEEKNGSRTENSIQQLNDISGGIIGVSDKGEWDEFPENSLPAIEEAAKTDIDFVLVDVKKTSDGEYILFADATTERMLFTDEVFTVGETDLKTLTSYPLRNSCGGSNTEKTEYFIPTLKEALICAEENDIPLILRCSATDVTGVTQLISGNNASDRCVILAEGSKKEVTAAMNGCDKNIGIISAIKGNVIFNIVSFVNSIDKSGAAGVELRTGNRYGINYYKSLIGNYSEKMRVIADVTSPETCGARQDSEKWWSDLISRGYSVIITDHADMFSEYKNNCEKARLRLSDLYRRYVTEHTLPDFKDEALNDYKKAYTDAVAFAESLLHDNSASLQDLNDSYAALSKAANDIKINFSALEDGSAGTTITLPRILLCIAAVIVVIAVQIYFFRRRKKAG